MGWFPIINDGDEICLSSLNGSDQRFKVINNGPVEAIVSATLALPVGITVASYTASQGSFDSGTGVWSVGALAANGSATIDFCLTIDDTCELPAVITLTVNNDSCVEAETGDNVGTRTLSGVTCCQVIECLGTIEFTVNAGDTGTITDDGNGTDNVEASQILHVWSSDDSIDPSVVVDAGGAILDLVAPPSTDADQLITVGTDGKHFLNIEAVIAALEAVPLDCAEIGSH